MLALLAGRIYDHAPQQNAFPLGSPMPSTVKFEPHKMVRELIAFGEPEAADRLVKLDARAIEQIGVRAYQLWVGIMLDTAICLAVVEYIEGAPRPLRRKRRVYPKTTHR